MIVHPLLRRRTKVAQEEEVARGQDLAPGRGPGGNALETEPGVLIPATVSFHANSLGMRLAVVLLVCSI